MRTTPTPEHIASPQPAFMTIREFCAWSRIGRTATYKEIRSGRLKLRKVGAKSLVAIRDAEEWARSLPTAAA
jgi:hypothetical protein